MDDNNFCPECKRVSVIMDEQTGDVVCQNCGFVIRERNVAVFNNNKKLFTPGKHLFYNKRFLGFDETELSVNMKASIERLKHWVSFKPDIERKASLSKVFLENFLRELSLDFKITDVFKKNFQRNLEKTLKEKIKKSNQKAFLAALFCLLYRENGYLNPIKRVSEVTGVSKKLIFKHYQLLMIGMNKKIERRVKPASLANFLGGVSKRIIIPLETQNDFLKIFPRIYKKEIFMGKSKEGLMAGLLYCLLKEKRGYTTLVRVAEATGISEITIKSRSKDIRFLENKI